jgi:hypothetical protein
MYNSVSTAYILLKQIRWKNLFYADNRICFFNGEAYLHFRNICSTMLWHALKGAQV